MDETGQRGDLFPRYEIFFGGGDRKIQRALGVGLARPGAAALAELGRLIGRSSLVRARAAQKSSTAAAMASPTIERRSGLANCSSSCRFTIDPASKSTAGIWVSFSTIN
jgi:hypothetical protein